MSRSRTLLLLSCSLLLILGILWGQGVFSAVSTPPPTVGTPVAQPSTIVVNQATLLTVTSRITTSPDNPVVPASVKLERVDAQGIERVEPKDAPGRDRVMTARRPRRPGAKPERGCRQHVSLGEWAGGDPQPEAASRREADQGQRRAGCELPLKDPPRPLRAGRGGRCRRASRRRHSRARPHRVAR